MIVNSLIVARSKIARAAAYVAPGGGGGDPDAPSISGVSGTVATGNTLTITGTQFYHQDRTGLDLTAAVTNMEGASHSADGYDSNGGSAYSGTIKIWKDGSGYGKRHTGPGQITNILYHLNWSQATASRYIRWMLYIDTSVGDGTWPDNYWKIWYNAQASPEYNTFLLNFVKGGSNGAPTTVTFIDQDVAGSNMVSGNIPGGAWQNGKWYSFVIGIPQGSPHLWECWINGEKVIDFNYTVSATGTVMYDTELDTNADGNIGAGFAADVYWGMIEHSSSRLYDPTMVHIGNTSDFATASPKYQYLTQISDTENKIDADLTDLGAGPYWMWVTNARGLRSAAYAL